MIRTKTFKVFTGYLELRIYVGNYYAHKHIKITNRVLKLIGKDCGFDTKHRRNELQAASNRAGLHFAYILPNAWIPAAATKLKALGWKECKGA